MSDVDEVTQLKRLRAGKKGSITKRTAVIHRMISEGGSRTKIIFLHGALLKVHAAVIEIHDKIVALSELTDEDANWMEDVSETIDFCSAEVKDYLEARKDDEASTEASMTSSWVNKHRGSVSEAEVAEDELNLPADLYLMQRTCDLHPHVYGLGPLRRPFAPF